MRVRVRARVKARVRSLGLRGLTLRCGLGLGSWAQRHGQ